MKKVALAILALGFGIFGIGITMGMAHMTDAAPHAFGGCLAIFIGLMLMIGVQPDHTDTTARRIAAQKWFEASMAAHREAFNKYIQQGGK